MFTKKFGLAVMALLAFFCSGFVSESYVNKAIASSQENSIEKEAESKVKEIYPEFIKIVKNGANESEITAFAERNMDTVAISKRFCGAKNDKLIKTIIKFLIWRLKTEAIQTVTDYSLGDGMKSISKGKKVSVKCMLKKQATDPVEMIVTFSKNGDKLGKIVELVVVSIPLIEGARTPIKKYFEGKGIKINTIKDPAKRAQLSCDALEDFIKNHARSK